MHAVSEIVLKSSEPVVPYIIEIPNSKMPDEKAEDKIIFSAASEDILFQGRNCKAQLME